MNTQFFTTMQKIPTLLMLLFISSVTIAQKKPLNHDVYDSWQSISASAISKNGQFVYYVISPQEGDAQLVITTTESRHVGRVDRAANVDFSPDGKFLLAHIKPFYADTREAKIKKKKADEMPKDSLAIFSLETSVLHKIPDVKYYKIPEE